MFYIVVFLGGLLLTLLWVYPVRRLAFALGGVANPGGRSIHKEPTPMLGGIAIYMACLMIGVSLLLWKGMPWLRIDPLKLLGLFLGATFLLFVGILDDIVALRVRWKLLGQLISACIPAIFGFNIHAVQIPMVGSIHLGALGWLLFVVWVLAITNAVNLSDGMDGLASVVCFFAAIGNAIIALTIGNFFIAFFSFMLAGCMLGFLFHNFPPAKIFLGDTGSMLLGFLLAVTVIESNTSKRSTTLLVIAPLLLLCFSLLDVLLSVVRRFLRGKPIFSSDLGHIHHRLMSRFRNPRRVLLVVGMFSFFMMVVSLVTHFHTVVHPVVLTSVWFSAILVTVLFVRLLGYFRIDRIRYVLETREDVKFFTSLLGYLRYSLPKRNSFEALVQELDWVCQALRPHKVVVMDHSFNVVYSYTGEKREGLDDSTYHEEMSDSFLSVKWSNSTQNEDPTTCDVRLMFRELFGLFSQHWKRLSLFFDEHSSSSLEEVPTVSSTEATLAVTLGGPSRTSGSSSLDS